MIRTRPSIGREPLAPTLAPPTRPLLGLLGRPALLAGTRLTPLSLRPKAIALIAFLALEGKEIARRDLARLLFPEAEEPLAVLRWHLSHLRSKAPSLIARRLRATRDGVALAIPTDVGLFRTGVPIICRRPATPGADRVLALYRDDLVAGLSVSAAAEFDNWLYVLQESLRRDLRRATLAFARGALDRGAQRQAVDSLARLVTVDPYCEDAHVLLIQAYDALGEGSRAAAAYDRYQRIVRRELAAEPQPALARQFGPVLLGHSAGGTVAAFVASQTDVAGLILLEAMIGDRAFTENAAAQAAPLATRLGRPVAGFDAYLSEWRARRPRYSDEAERLFDRWVRFALAPVPGGAYRERGLRMAVEAEWASIIAADSVGALAQVTCPVMIVQALKPWLGGRPYFSSGIVTAQLRAVPHAEIFAAEHSDHGTIIRDPESGMVEALVRFLGKCAGVANPSRLAPRGTV